MSFRFRTAWIVAYLLLLACELPPRCVSAESRSATRRFAVLVGIDNYSASTLAGTQSSNPRILRNLQGAVNDVESMQEMLLLRYDFKPHEIVVLKNQAATRAAILRAIETHLQQAAKGDVALFYYSGHGSQVLNSLSAERDKRDESLVPADSLAGAHDIRDKELRRRFNRILDRGARLTVILDSCHSGSGVRGDELGRSVSRDDRDIADRTEGGPRLEDRGALVISAAQDSELAQETRDDDGTMRGVFSWAWLRAMRTAADSEHAIDTFLRAQAIVRAERPAQNPVIAGNAEARLTPLFRTRRGKGTSKTAVAVERVRSDGTFLLQGGWAHGITVGSELRPARGNSDVRLEVTALRGLGRCEARLVGGIPRVQAADLTAGQLLEVIAWAAPAVTPLRVWMPAVETNDGVVRWAKELAKHAEERKIRVVHDPVDDAPDWILRWRDGGWDLMPRNGRLRRFKTGCEPDDVLSGLEESASLFIQLPASATLVKAIDIGPGTDRQGVEPASDPADADYILAGRLTGEIVEYAWVRRGAESAGQRRTTLPLRTAWHSATNLVHAGLILQDAALRLRKVQAWHILEAPPGSISPYELILKRRRDNAAVINGQLEGFEDYLLVLRARTNKPPRRFIYAFTIDGNGKSLLLYPTVGSVENRFPLRLGDPTPKEFALEEWFTSTPPFGTDTYFLLTTDEPLPDPWIFEFDGLRSEVLARTPLEELFSSVGLRSSTPVRAAGNWSLERVIVQSSASAQMKGASE